MPRNFTGGKGHRSGQNSDSSTLTKSKKLFNDLMSDIRGGEDLDGVFIGRVIRKLGDGRVEVMYFENNRQQNAKAVIKGSLRGRGKRDAFVDLNSIVMLVHLGVDSGTTHEIMNVFSPQQVEILKKEVDLDDRLFNISGTLEKKDESEFEFQYTTEEPELDVDAI